MVGAGGRAGIVLAVCAYQIPPPPLALCRASLNSLPRPYGVARRPPSVGCRARTASVSCMCVSCFCAVLVHLCAVCNITLVGDMGVGK